MISVIIITYQRSSYIQRAINSVLSQSYKDFELIVVDDNNPDTIYRKELEKIMAEYKDIDNIKYIQHEKNKNGSAARNTGIAVAKGEYIAFLDDDDYFLPNRLEKLSNMLDNNPEYNGVYSSVIVTHNKKIIGFVNANNSGNMKNKLLLNQFAFGTGSNLFFRADAVKKLNGFDESFIRHQDIEFMLRFFNENLLLAYNEPLVVKVQDDRSNEVDIDKLINLKKYYFEVFAGDINMLSQKEKEMFYQQNYSELLDAAVVSKKYKDFFKLKKEFNKIITFTLKNHIRFISLFVNNYIKIEKIKYLIIREKVLKNYKNEANYIQKIEKGI